MNTNEAIEYMKHDHPDGDRCVSSPSTNIRAYGKCRLDVTRSTPYHDAWRTEIIAYKPDGTRVKSLPWLTDWIPDIEYFY